MKINPIWKPLESNCIEAIYLWMDVRGYRRGAEQNKKEEVVAQLFRAIYFSNEGNRLS